MTSLGELRESKSQWRRVLEKRRRTIDEITRSAEAASLRSAVLDWAEQRSPRVVAAYVPVRGEPGSVELLDALRAAGCRVLLPVVVGAAPLDWAEYAGPGSLDRARYGLLEPNGPRLGAAELGAAGAVLVPALAVDERGVRLGRGAGHYDRSLPLADPAARLIGMVRDAEFVPELPGEEHDIRMHAVITPGRGLVAVGGEGHGHAV